MHESHCVLSCCTTPVECGSVVSRWYRDKVCLCHCLQDYPSVYQVRQLLTENDVIIVFATVEASQLLYEVRDHLWKQCCRMPEYSFALYMCIHMYMLHPNVQPEL